MGIGGQHNLTWRSVPVDWENIVHVLQKRFEKARVSTGRSRPSVAIDAYVVAYNFIGTTLGPIGVIMTLATQFSSAYVDVHIHLDGATRHHSKRATIERIAKRERDRIKLIDKRAELTRLLRDQSAQNRAHIVEMEKEIRKLEKSAKRALPECFDSKLQHFVDNFESANRGNIQVRVAEYQADPAVARSAVNGEVDGIISGDSDFVMYIGPSGPLGCADFSMRSVKCERKKGASESTVKSMLLITGQSDVAKQLEEIAGSRIDGGLFPKIVVPADGKTKRGKRSYIGHSTLSLVA
jgi:hypothetical protein